MNNYLSELCDRFGRGWNRFWFTPTDPLPLCLLRIGTGLVTFWYLLSHSADLVRWFGPSGLLPAETVRRFTGASRFAIDPQAVFRYSYLYVIDEPAALWTVHGLGLVVAILLTVGLFTRLSTVISLVIVLSYVHRAPMITGLVEPVLTMLLFYLCLAPAGRYLSLDFLRTRREAERRALMEGRRDSQTAKSLAANISQRLIQVHLALFYLMFATTKFAGEPWWSGEAMWWLAAHTESRLVDLTFLSRWPYLFNAWTHLIVWFELAFAILIWNRLARPLLLAAAVICWVSVAILTGMLSYGALMVLANVVFVDAAVLRRSCESCCRPMVAAPGLVAAGK